MPDQNDTPSTPLDATPKQPDTPESPSPSQSANGNVPTWFADQPAPEPQPTKGTNKKKRSRLIALVMAIVVVVLGAGGALAYNLWYQNPEKVVTDSIMNALKAKSATYTGSIVTTGDQAMKLEVTGRGEGISNELAAKLTFKYDDKDITLEGNGVTDSKGDLYFKVKNVDTIVDQYLPAIDNPESSEMIDKLVAKVNDQWIKVSADDLNSTNEDAAGSQKCLSDAVKKFQDDEPMKSEIIETYKQNKFINVDNKLGSENGSLGYALSINESNAKSFVDDLKNTQIYKTMQSCDKTFKIENDDLFKKSEDGTTTKIELWVSRFSHQITKLNVESTRNQDKTTLLFEPEFDAAIGTIKAPEKFTTIKQLQSDIEEFVQASMAMPQAEEAVLFEESFPAEA